MRPSLGICAIVVVGLLACAGLSSGDEGWVVPAEAVPTQSASGAASKGDYTIVRRVRLLDQGGFDQPVEAYSLLVPQDWRVEGGVVWSQSGCAAEMVNLQATLRSPDGALEMRFHPGLGLEYSSDPAVQQAVALGGGVGLGGCRFTQPFTVEEYARQSFMPQVLPGATVRKVERLTEIEQALRPMLQQMAFGPGTNAAFQVAGVEADHPDGRIGLALFMRLQVDSPTPGMYGGQAVQSSYVINFRVSIIGPAERREEMERQSASIIASMRTNPEWERAVQNVRANVDRINREGAAARRRITFESNKEISEMNMRSWERRMEGQAKGAHDFSQAIRGVETWQDPGGGQVELGGGYTNAWSRGDGTYLLSQDPNFDPRRSLEGGWQPMTRPAP